MKFKTKNSTINLKYDPNRHDKSWEVVHEYAERFRVWSIKTEHSITPTLLPWLDEMMEKVTYNRVQSEECSILYICLPVLGVVPAMKLQFILQTITSFLAARASNSIALVAHANRAGEAKKRFVP